ncbi:tissue factor pathway inhibitor isoform X5 [Nannospalax galili]|uniref:tissue factor pathway inhibitor isoform X5 n=1 Tax=Nannospalax galili TaxID=1026970 RepID=UPI00111C7C7D|nr:tissue factor pathway inhibitor isoform X5 [Nannospalax galili]
MLRLIYMMKRDHVFWTSMCLLLSVAFEPLHAASEEEEDANITDSVLPPLKLKNSFCALKVDDGPCKAMMRRFFFNIFTQQCEEFIYGGCEGNKNRFESLEECKEKCVVGYTKNVRTTFRAVNELQDNDYKIQPDAVNNSLIPQPTKVPNLSVNQLQVDDYKTQPNTVNNSLITRPTKISNFWEYRGPSWCLTSADSGLCQASELRFYYNAAIGKCRPFKYTGCGGNENNFTSKRACIKACKRGFIYRKSKEGLIKTKRKRKKPSVKIVYEKIIKKI